MSVHAIATDLGDLRVALGLRSSDINACTSLLFSATLAILLRHHAERREEKVGGAGNMQCNLNHGEAK